jgi:hypothetical protein
MWHGNERLSQRNRWHGNERLSKGGRWYYDTGLSEGGRRCGNDRLSKTTGGIAIKDYPKVAGVRVPPQSTS